MKLASRKRDDGRTGCLKVAACTVLVLLAVWLLLHLIAGVILLPCLFD